MNTKNTDGRKRNSAETKRKIYECADELFRQYGFEDVSVDSIVEKAGISKGSFYVHFQSKDSLIAALITKYVSESDFNYRVYEKSFTYDMTAAEMLMELIEKIADNILSIGYSLIKIAYRIQIEQNDGTDTLLNYKREIYDVFRNLINRGISTGEFKTDIPVDVIAEHFVMALRGLTYEWCIRFPNFDLKGQIMEHFKIFLYGIQNK